MLVSLQIMQLDIQTPTFPALIPLMALCASKQIAAGIAHSDAFLPAFLVPGASSSMMMRPNGAQIETMTLLGVILRIGAMVMHCCHVPLTLCRPCVSVP
jgi:hypothetical protein